MSITTGEAPTPTAQDPTQSKPTTAETRIHWAGATPATSHMPPPAATPDPATARRQALEQKFEAMRARNWITDRMVAQYQKHWHCSREAALERLLSKTGA